MKETVLGALAGLTLPFFVSSDNLDKDLTQYEAPQIRKTEEVFYLKDLELRDKKVEKLADSLEAQINEDIKRHTKESINKQI